VSLAHDDVVPHIIIQSSRLRPGEFETHTAKGLLQHYRHFSDMAVGLGDVGYWGDIVAKVFLG
jgi:hypothetical protein